MPFSDHMQRNRYELKYLIDEHCARRVRDFVRVHLRRDRFAQAALGGAYPVYSVYLDSPDLSLFNATLHGHKNRFKLRVRYYDHQADSPVFFEIKRRVNDVILKERAAVRRDAINRLLAGAPASREDLVDPTDHDAFSSLHHFCHLRHLAQAGGRTIVAYTREAWNAADNDDLRVTFDRAVRGAWFNDREPIDRALNVGDERRWIHPPLAGEVVLELKFTGTYPRWMQELVASCDLYRVCMAKYVNCVMAMGPRGVGLRRERQPHRMKIDSGSPDHFSLPRYPAGGLGWGKPRTLNAEWRMLNEYKPASASDSAFSIQNSALTQPPPQPSPGVPGEGVNAAGGEVRA
jgi:hypothetical protein